MKKVVISTFNNSDNNYGALFQSCALSFFINKLGYDAYNVTIKSRKNSSVSLSIFLKRKIKKLLKLKLSRQIERRKKEFRRFAQSTQKQICFNDEDELYGNPPVADVYVSGSDQVWNPTNIHRDFFLTYADNESKKISYAASMGNEKIPQSNEKEFAQYISSFDCVSVREDTMLPIIKKYTDKKIHHNIDPVFLMTCDEWKKLATPYKTLKFDKFIMVYVIEWNTQLNTKLAELKKRLNLPVVAVNCGNMSKICADQVIYDASPNEFLDILDKADFTVTSSFHGTSMSIIFNKPFVTALGNDKSSRIKSLLRHFLIENAADFNNSATLDYKRINAQIEQDREIAKDYLISSIES